MLIEDVPDEVHEVLVRRAAAAGQSLQQYLAGELVRLASTPTLTDVLDRIESEVTSSLSAAAAVVALGEERERA